MSYHLYDIDELYTNADGTIQFVELSMPSGGGNGENAWNSHYLISTNGSTTHSFLASNLPSSLTASTHVLLATAGFAAAAGVTPNFIIPNGFLFSTGGTISWGSTQLDAINGSGTVDSVAYSSLPVDGHSSLNVAIDTNHAKSSAENTPTNFAGQAGHIALANHPPVVESPLPDQVGGVGQAFSAAVPAFTDPDADSLTYSAKLGSGAALPAWLSFSPDTRELGGTPASTDTGSKTVRITASDGNGGMVSDTFVIKIIGGHVIAGTESADTLEGTTKMDSIDGLGGADTITGGLGNDTLDGGSGADVIKGGGGIDTFLSSPGSDRVNGGGSADKFVFVDAPSKDILQQFQGGVDVIQLENSVYTALEAAGQLMASNLQAGTQAQITAGSGDADDYIKYDTEHGKLYYDADGSGAGAPLLIATVTGGTFDPANDVFVI
jgi:Ca2+-binding RTX toxin-like protein